MLCSDEEQLSRICGAIKQANDNMQPVKIGSGIGYEDRLTINRNIRLKNGKDWCMRMWDPCPEDKDIKSLGPVDAEIGLLKIARLDGSTLAVIYNFACHLLLGVPKGGITADFPGFASKIIEDNLGNGAIALFIQGANGDIGEFNDKDFAAPHYADDFGRILGLSVLDGLRGIECKSEVTLGFASETIELPRRNDIPTVIENLEQEQAELIESLLYCVLNFKSFLPLYLKHLISPDFPAQPAYKYMREAEIGASKLTSFDAKNRVHLDKYLANISAMEKISRIQDKLATLKKHQKINKQSGEKNISAEIEGLKIGDCLILAAPIELLTEIGLGIKQCSPFKHTLVASDSNGYMHYGVPANLYANGGYEATECLLAPEWQQIFETTAEKIINKLNNQG
jgi:hypothetical protein